MTTRFFSFKSYHILLTWSLFLTSFIFTSLHAQCPTVTNTTQSFCDVESILVGNLVATDNGGGVVWYDTLTSTTPLLNIEGLVDGEDYYADDNTGSCGPRQRVDVIILGPPDGLNFQGICLDDTTFATIADLVATGNNVQWYLTQTGGLPLAEATVLLDNTIYYADQENTDTGCRTSRLSVLVNVGITPVPSGDSIQEFCVTPTFTPTIGDLIASGNNNWYVSLFSALPLPIETPINNGQVYYASTIDPPCESTGRLAVLVLLTNSPDPGIDSTIELCEDAGSIDLFSELGGTPDSGGTWFPLLNSGTGVFDPNIDLPGAYTYTVAAINVCPAQSATVTVTLVPPPVAGENGSIDLCTDSGIVDLFDTLGGIPELGGTWSPLLTSGTGVFDPSVDTGGLYTYTVNGTPPCSDATATVTVLVSTVTNAGEDASIEICDDLGVIDLFDSLGGTPDTGGTWSPILASGTGVFDPNIDADGTYTYTVFGTAPCVDDSASVTIIVSELADPGIDATIELCSNEGTIDLFTSLGGTPDAGGTWSPVLTSGTGVFDPSIDPDGIYTYTIVSGTACFDVSSNVNVSVEIAPVAGEDASLEICDDIGLIDLFTNLGGTPDSGGIWSPALLSGTGIFDPTLDPEGTYTYTVSGTLPCSDDFSSVTITVSELPDPGVDGAVQLCSNDGTIDLFNSLGGSPDLGGTWSPVLASGTGIFDPTTDPEGIYTYSISGSTVCADVSSNVNVSIEIAPNAGEDASLEICDDNGLIDLFTNLGGTPDIGGVWSPALLSGTGIFDPTLDPEGTYIYTVSGILPCTDTSASVVITVTESPDPGEDATIELCSDSGPIDLFNSLGGSPDLGGTWSPALTSGTGVFDPNLDSEGIYTYSLSGATVCADASSSVNVSVEEAPEAGENAILEVCSNISTIDLLDSLNGTPDAGGTWSPALASGTNIFDPLIDSAGIYTYTVLGTFPCSDDSSTIEITIIDTPSAGNDNSIFLCGDDSIIDLFDSLGTTADVGGTWSPTLSSGTGLFDPTIDIGGTYTYTVIGNVLCADDSASITVTLDDLPNTGTDATIELCSNNGSVDLFNSLGGSPDLGGTWTPVLASGTGIFDPIVDVEGIYTYSISGSSVCPDVSSNVTVSVETAPEAGEDTSIEVCDSDGTINLFDSLDGTPDLGGTWSPTLASGTNIFDPSLDTDGTYTYTVIGTSPCIDDSASLTITVNETPDAGTNASIDICDNSGLIDLFDSLGGTPEIGGTWSPALTSGTGIFDPSLDPEGLYTYTLTAQAPCVDATATVNITLSLAPDAGNDADITICNNSGTIDLFDSLGGTPDTGGTWSPLLNSGSGIFDPNIDIDGAYTYTVLGTAPCPDANSIVTVDIVDELDAGENGTIEICTNASVVDLFDSLNGTPQLGGTWSPELASGTGVFDPSIDPDGVYTYTLSGAIAPCIDDSATVAVSIIPEPNAGVNSIITVCVDDGNTDLFDFLGGTPDTNGTWSPALTSGTGVFDPNVDLEGTYTYTVVSIECNLMDMSSVRVTIGEKPDVSGTVLETEPNICIGSDLLVELSGANQLIDGIYTIDYTLSGANDAFNTADITVSGGNSSFIIPAELFENSGISTITITGFYFEGEFCSGDTDLIAAIEINILETETPQLSDQGNSFCEQENPTVADLSNNILDSESIIWYDLPENGVAFSESDPLVDGETYYGALQGANGCESFIRLEITVSVIECEYELVIPDGFSPNGDSINDEFRIVNLEILYPNFKLSVYNRYGNILYEGNIDSQRWNGKARNKDKVLPIGVYFYILEFNDGEREPLQGRVYLSI